ncbi:hypothetical protein OG982_06095 [Streptomyces sp. NBC_01551]|uniref:hypothetical protein n=1 Tax=Streptomyces sp. NBC_01551 TaxID=2975876 RepID=UPI002253D528|nr:hypothetical protein [Streptomyces sp. NBC_01551]MCX4525264.1 hypothetical protein [Streptomyces sp. NBC_01551]
MTRFRTRLEHLERRRAEAARLGAEVLALLATLTPEEAAALVGPLLFPTPPERNR